MTPSATRARRAPSAKRAVKTSARKATKGFASKAQWRKFYADPKLRSQARRKAHETAGGKVIRYRRLPARKRPAGVRSAR